MQTSVDQDISNLHWLPVTILTVDCHSCRVCY